MKRIIFATALAAGLASPVLVESGSESGAEFETGIHAYSIGAFRDALNYLEPLAADGDPTAQYWLGIMYFEGKGVPQDDIQAYMWLTLAADQGNRGARLGKNGLERRMNPEQITEAQRLARNRDVDSRGRIADN